MKIQQSKDEKQKIVKRQKYIGKFLEKQMICDDAIKNLKDHDQVGEIFKGTRQKYLNNWKENVCTISGIEIKQCQNRSYESKFRLKTKINK